MMIDPLSQLGWAPLHFVNFCPAEKAAPLAKLLLDAGAAVEASNTVSGPGLPVDYTTIELARRSVLSDCRSLLL